MSRTAYTATLPPASPQTIASESSETQTHVTSDSGCMHTTHRDTDFLSMLNVCETTEPSQWPAVSRVVG